jgi:hypothetical protein
MIFSGTFFLNASGLFDFDLTFVAETILFIILALVVTFAFISPISEQLGTRQRDINTDLRTSILLFTRGYDRLAEAVDLLTSETNELNRQLKLTKNLTNSSFEEEVLSVQEQNSILLSKFRVDLSIKSACIFSNIRSELIPLTDKFFKKHYIAK